jgi:hypothetical protein
MQIFKHNANFKISTVAKYSKTVVVECFYYWDNVYLSPFDFVIISVLLFKLKFHLSLNIKDQSNSAVQAQSLENVIVFPEIE